MSGGPNHKTTRQPLLEVRSLGLDMRKTSLKRIVVIFFVMMLFDACTTADSYSVSSMDGKKCLSFEYSNSMIPGDDLYVKLYLHGLSTNKNQYVKMIWSELGTVDVDWGASPIKIRSLMIRENTMPTDIVDVASTLSAAEREDFHKPNSSWRSYDFTGISSGKYEPCKGSL